MKKTILPLLLTIIWFGCSTNKPFTKNNDTSKSHYHIQNLSTVKSKDSAVVVGKIHNMAGENIDCFYINANSRKHYSKCDGKIIFKLKPDKYNFKGYFTGYDNVKTNTYEVNKGDSILIDFYLEVEFNPIE